MKILVMGATGRVGRAVVAEATRRGHDVTAFARKPHTEERAQRSDPAEGPNVSPFPGDALQPARVAEAVPGHDATVSALGKRGDEPTLTEGLANLLAAMRTHDVRRIVAVGGRGVLDDPRGGLVRDRPDYPTFLKAVSAEHLAAFRELQKSGLDWTMVCPPRLTDDAPDRIVLSAESATGPEAPVSFAAVARAILDILEEGRFVGQRVALAPEVSADVQAPTATRRRP